MASILILLTCLSVAELEAMQDLGKALGNLEWDVNSSPCNWSGVTCNKNEAVTEIVATGKGLEGKIPDSIGNLYALTRLELWNNRLRGSIPASIGQLTALRQLRLGTNRLNGSIPPQIGSLKRLLVLELDNNRLNGTIPPSLSNLSLLAELLLPTNRLSGSISPDFGRLANLTKLWLHSNQLSGPLPLSFENLTLMSDLTLSYNSFSGNISFIHRMPLLQSLKLNRNNFSGPIPNVSLSNLTVCDLGFNQLGGNIPASLALPKLQFLLLGHNRLQGTIPNAFGNLSSLSRLDVSHNLLTGSTRHLASVEEKDFAFNYFEDQNGTLDLNCNASSAKQDVCFPSTTGAGGAFRINAGGPEVKFDGDTFVADSTGVSTGLHQIGKTFWALEISGLEGSNNSKDTLRGDNIEATNQDAIYKTAKWSSNYLAYHGTRLTNQNYTVTLYFVETFAASRNSRLFDVFVQGQMVRHDLDIWVEKNSGVPYIFNVSASVTDGTISIELVGNRYNYYYTVGSGPIISAISVLPTNSNNRSLKRKLVGSITGGVVAFFLLIVAVCLIIIRRRRSSRSDDESLTESVIATTNTMEKISRIGPTIYTYEQLWNATDGFNEKLLLGKGGFGAVYKGTLPDGSVVAVKQLTKKGSRSDAKTFKKEITILSMLQHRNLVGINGYCLESENSLLVCDYMENGSLEKALFHGGGLDWETRMKIAIDAASGLQYLHEDSKYHVIHCDVKPANILLDKDMNACVADFGLARFFKDRTSKTVQNKVGTFGYMAPEYIYWNNLSEKVDVYSFGVVLLELLSGRHNAKLVNKSWDEDGQSSNPMVEHVQELVYHGGPSSLLELIDEKLHDKFDREEALDMSIVALLCTQYDPNARPRMRDVWLMLSKTIEIPPLPDQLKMPKQKPKQMPIPGGISGNYMDSYTSLDAR